MKMHELGKVVSKRAKKVGRGESSGKGKTSGRGMKGQKARGKLPLSFEGGQLPIIKRLPFQRGVGNKRPGSKLAVSLSSLEIFNSGDSVNLDSLVEKKIISASDATKKIKIVAGKISKALNIQLPTTQSAKKEIEKSKGKVEHV
ncbi:MAG: 50S ribosomal protein L15 [bacterium]|nr:50S ribosomal protein L15 [bacterium]